MFKTKTLIVVTGMHRSGTSAIAQLLEQFGVIFGDNLIARADDNPRGFYEDKQMVSLNEAILMENHMSWDVVSMNPLKNFSDIGQAQTFMNGFLGKASIQGVKDPRLSLTLPLWETVFPQDLAVAYFYMLRHPLAVAASLETRNGFTPELSLYLWLVYVITGFNAVRSKHYLVLNYDEILNEQTKNLKKIEDFLGVEFSGKITIEKELNRSQNLDSGSVKDKAIYDLAIRVYRLVNNWTDSKSDIDEWSVISTEARLHLGGGEFYLHQLINSRSEAQEQNNFILKQAEDISALKTSTESLRERIAGLDHQLQDTGTQLWSANHKVDELIQELNDTRKVAEDKAKFAEEKLQSLEHVKQLFQLSLEEKEEVSYQLRITEDELWRQKEFVKQLTQSISWRITKPLRYIRTIQQKLKHSFIGRYVYAIRLCKNNFIKYISLSKGNAFALKDQISRRQDELFSSSHILRNSGVYSGDWPLIDLSLVTFNNGSWLQEFIRSLEKQLYPLSKINLTIVDNSSTDNTPSLIKQLLSEKGNLFNRTAFYSQPNHGFGSGHDKAIRGGEAEYLIVSNVDVSFLPDTITSLVETAIRDDKDVACWEVRQAPFEHPKYQDPVTLEVSWSSHCFVMMRREAYFAVGGYDPLIFMYGEDVELSFRFRSHGWRLRYVPKAVLNHYTYAEANEFKPVQFLGSTFANGLIRFRYGDWRDVLIGISLQLMLLFRPLPAANLRAPLWRNFMRLLYLLPQERLKGRHNRGRFPFRGFDYDLRREGAFYKISEPAADTPLVSIITRTFQGRDRYLRECITSVLNQTYPHIEHIIVEDGGATHTALIEQLKESYGSHNIRYLPQPKKGRSSAGNQGMRLAQGRWALFLDDDDLLFPDHVEVLVAELQKDSQVSAAYSLAWEVKTDVEVSGEYSEKSHESHSLFYQPFSREVLYHHNYIPIQAILFEVSLFKKYGGFDETLDQLEDWNLWVKYSLHADFKWVEKTTSLYRTPYSAAIALKRKSLLDEAYPEVLERNQQLKEGLIGFDLTPLNS